MFNCLVKMSCNFEPTPHTGKHWPVLDEEKLRGSSLIPSLVYKVPSVILSACYEASLWLNLIPAGVNRSTCVSMISRV